MITTNWLLTLQLLNPSVQLTNTPDTSGVQSFEVKLQIVGLRSDQGEVLAALYNKKEHFLKDQTFAFRKAKNSINGTRATLRFRNLPPGEYAVLLFHDENQNRKLDTNFIGIPTEGVGTSNNAKPKFGPPRYEDAKFRLEDKNLSQTVELLYF